MDTITSSTETTVTSTNTNTNIDNNDNDNDIDYDHDNEYVAIQQDHLLVLQHGLNATDGDYIVMKDVLAKSHPTMMVYAAKSNNTSLFNQATHQGIDACGDRLFNEIVQLTKQYQEQIKKISIIGHSLGGLITRHAIGKLYQHGYFNNVQPIQYISLSSPHCGSRRPKSTAFNKLACVFTDAMIKMTGKQLMLTDDPENPLLLKMTDPNDIYYKGLELFKSRILYSNIENDIQVNFCTSDMTHRNPYTKRVGKVEELIEMIFHEKYPHIINPSTQAPFVPVGEDSFKNEEKRQQLLKMLQNLQTLTFDRYHCYFKNFLSHTNVIMKRSYLNNEGQDVIQHVNDHLIDE
ncbi:esterase/lipase/thioesterase domain-containing protein [Cavenderia fasciculata]|uniref:Esterase/lipase/thioesterase domain-containing protein n=1 Tax=Cavenderia fasciculata TaxID=261658 RepID=F4QE29_CACFS|nr:esterase/lipase/thioesterase domain-containing protein [Cavenderia fasciculata]EGG13976.1 esterase/lipase/thioesterase domain-containing protein [Cavenderia fasciculata]|eukprot:XP_004350684.1 esterase/lipase/thioesterase domain-containing protein [Cavenderia fasciculata]